MITRKALKGMPYAGNPHVRLDEVDIGSAVMPRHGSLFYKRIILGLLLGGLTLSVFGITKVKFDANGGNASAAVQLFYHGDEYYSLPSASRNGYLFEGWWTEKEGGDRMPNCGEFDARIFPRGPILYAHWRPLVKLTLKDDSAYVRWDPLESSGEDDLDLQSRPDIKDGGSHEGKGTVELLEGMRVYVHVDECTFDNKDNRFVFQKWTVSPLSADLGPDFHVPHRETEFTMPGVAVTLQATYIDKSTSGRLTCYASASPSSVISGEEIITPPFDAFEWSPDGGKTWYKARSYEGPWVDYDYGDYPGDSAVLKAGKYTIKWRSTDPNWDAPNNTTTAVVRVGDDGDNSSSCYDDSTCFVYIPPVVIDVMTIKGGECTASSKGGTATMSSKDGRATGKSITFTAKEAKDYAFQGWAFKENWEGPESPFKAITASWKVEDSDGVAWELNDYISPDDGKVHVVAVFKALADYSVDDIVFNHLSSKNGIGYSAYERSGGKANVDVRGVVGCSMEYALQCGHAAFPLSYKLDGKLPAGLKFDAKTGVLSGVPTKVGKTSVAIVATARPKISKALTVNIEIMPLPEWLVGDYRGLTAGSGPQGVCYEDCECDEVWIPEGSLLELSVTSAGKVSGKVLTGLGARSVSGSLEWCDLGAEQFSDELYDEGNEPDVEFRFWHDAKDDSWCHVNFRPNGTIDGIVDSYDKTTDMYFGGGEMNGMRQNKELLTKSSFLDKYYTFAFCYQDDGYGYLTLKTDKKGGVKVVGQLPNGEKISMSALVLPIVDGSSVPDDISAHIYVFASPSSKKYDWVALPLVVTSDGTISIQEVEHFEDEYGTWMSGAAMGFDNWWSGAFGGFQGRGALYSEAKTLEGFYWNVFCAWGDKVKFEYSWVDPYDGRCREAISPEQFYDKCLFNVAVMGDKKGAINLVQKSPAPWYDKADGWNYWYDKKGNEITDPSQLSISFAKATGIFTGKASVYFDYWQPNYKRVAGEYEDMGSVKHTTATLPYSGVMVREENDGEVSYTGFGSAVHTYKYTYEDNNGKIKTDTRKVTLPVFVADECDCDWDGGDDWGDEDDW